MALAVKFPFSGKIEKYSSFIYGANLWGKFMGKIYEKNFRGKFPGKISGENFRGKFLVKQRQKVPLF